MSRMNLLLGAIWLVIATPCAAQTPDCITDASLTPAFFGHQSDYLSSSEQATLDDNYDVVRQCEPICIEIRGYADDTESDADAISETRAGAVWRYYVDLGIAADRIAGWAMGVDPESNSDEDPTLGDSRVRRVESLAVACSG